MSDKRKRSLEIASMSYEGRKIRKGIKRGADLRAVTDKNINRGDLTEKQKDKLRTKARHTSMTEKRKNKPGKELRAMERAGRETALRGSAQAATNELASKQALRKAATKKKEETSPTPFKMLDKSKMKAKATADSKTTFSNKDQDKMGVFNYGMAKE